MTASLSALSTKTWLQAYVRPQFMLKFPDQSKKKKRVCTQFNAVRSASGQSNTAWLWKFTWAAMVIWSKFRLAVLTLIFFPLPPWHNICLTSGRRWCPLLTWVESWRARLSSPSLTLLDVCTVHTSKLPVSESSCRAPAHPIYFINNSSTFIHHKSPCWMRARPGMHTLDLGFNLECKWARNNISCTYSYRRAMGRFSSVPLL